VAICDLQDNRRSSISPFLIEGIVANTSAGAFTDLAKILTKKSAAPLRHPAANRPCVASHQSPAASLRLVGSSSLSIVLLAADTAASRLSDVPALVPSADSTDHFQKPRLMPWITRYSMPRYSMRPYFQTIVAMGHLRISIRRARQYSR